MFEQVTLDQLIELANRAGKEIARKYPGIKAEDIASEALAALLEKIDRVADMSPGYLYEVLRRDAISYAASERYQYIVDTSQYLYTPHEIKALLEHCYFDPVAWDVPTGKDDWLFAELEGHSIGVSLIDIREAMERIKPESKHIIEQRYFHDDDSIHRQTVSRAVDDLVRALNCHVNEDSRGHEGPGARKAMSNSASQRRTSYEMGKPSKGRDPVKEYQAIVEATTSTVDFQAPPGTWFNWDKYKN